MLSDDSFADRTLVVAFGRHRTTERLILRASSRRLLGHVERAVLVDSY
jgi:hypothetical protein